MKRAVITDEISQDLTTALRLAAEFGLDGVELRSVAEKGPHEWDEKQLCGIKSLCAEYGLAVCAFSSPCFKCDADDDEQVAAHLEIFERCARAAAFLGVGILRAFTFWSHGTPLDEAALARIVTRYRPVVERAEAAGLTVVIENDPSVYATDAAGLRRVVDAVGSPAVKVLWDAGNDIWDPLGERPFPDGYALVQGKIGHLHVKDARMVDGKPQAVRIGDGAVDWKGQFAALQRDGYVGWAVLETHYRKHAVISERQMRNPKGGDFSRDGYAATRECLEAWPGLL